MMADEGDVPDLLLERYRLGELPPDWHARLQAQLERDPGLRRRMQDLERSDETIREAAIVDTLTRGVRERLAVRASAPIPRRMARTWTLAAAAVAATAALLALGTVTRTRSTSAVPDLGHEDRIKGLRPALTVFRKTAAGSEPLSDGDRARPGDLLRVGYQAAGRPFGVIVSVDGRGGVTVHLPRRGERAAPLSAGGTVLLDEAYELDDAPRWERFYFVTGPAPFEVGPVVAAVQRASAAGAPAGTAVLPSGLEQSTVSVAKGDQ